MDAVFVEEEEQVLLRYEDPGEFLLSELQDVFDSDSPTSHCDVEFHCKDKTVIKTHSAVLAIVSPYLKIILTESWDPHAGASITIPDFNGKDIRNLLRFLYTGKATLTPAEFTAFQELVCEFQVGMDENSAIILEEKEASSEETEKSPSKDGKEGGNEENVISIELTEESAAELLNLPPKHSCPYCTAVFRSAMQLKRHKQRHKRKNGQMPAVIIPDSDPSIVNEAAATGEAAPDDPLITEVELLLEDDSIFKKKTLVACELCPSAFISQSKLNDHMLKHTGERPFKCPLCEKSYPVKATLTAHLRIHADDKPHQCERCGKAFLIRSLLEQHLRTHTDERPYACEICGKAFRNQSNLIGHKKTHTSDRPHSCTECNKTFNRKHDLDAHLRIHTGDKPFPCTQCTKSFRFRSALRVHLKGVHGVKNCPN